VLYELFEFRRQLRIFFLQRVRSSFPIRVRRIDRYRKTHDHNAHRKNQNNKHLANIIHNSPLIYCYTEAGMGGRLRP
jgi:hypothetical protein